MLHTRILAAGIVFLLFVTGPRAQPRTHKGTHELSVHISPDLEGAVGDMIFAQAGYGLFLRDGLSARATAAYAVLEDVAGEDSDYRMSELGLASEFHFRRARTVVPYLGAMLGWRRSDFADLAETGLVYGPSAGLKLFLADNVALDFDVTYRLASANVFINDFVPEDTDLTSVIGLRVFF